ncbi:MAG TPA: MG2 domain-containing protein, partial [Saprospiraceae bacterium]|nr:MG2 domain-containing protein [Saprospiraceae bacterium]
MTRSSFFLLLLLSTAFLLSCNKKEKLSDPTQFRDHMLAYTRGTINAQEELRFIFKQDLFLNKDLDEDFLATEPFLPGSISHPRPNELVFQPEGRWQNGTEYSIKMKLSDAFPGVFDSDLNYKINIVKQYLRVELSGVLLNSKGHQRYLLDLAVADDVQPEALKKCLKTDASETIITRSGEKKFKAELRFAGNLNEDSYLVYDGKPIHADESGRVDLFDEKAFEDFGVLFTKYDQKTRRFKIFFTRLLNSTQDLDGLIQLDGRNCDYSREQNALTIYMPQLASKEESELRIAAQVKDINDQLLDADLLFTLDRSVAKPGVQMALNGNYIPTRGKVLIPIRTRSLKSVQVSVVEVPRQNVKYYLSWHGLLKSNQDYLRQLGRPVYYEEVTLPGSELSSREEWENYALDLTQKFDRNPGAMYAVELRFGPQNAHLDCEDTRKSVLSSSLRKEIAGWENRGGYYYWGNSMWPDRWSYNFNWKETNNPCKLSYFLDQPKVSRNLMVSDLAIIAKQGKQETSVVVADLHDLSSVSNAQVELFDYQGMSLGKRTTSSSGRAQFKLSRRAQVALVQHNNQEVYLSLRQENANALSAFPISGSSAEEDRFFLYSERGVWRPGDSIHLCLMMDRRNHDIPSDLPMVLEFYDYKGSLLNRQKHPVEEGQQLYCFNLGTSTQDKTGIYEARLQIGATTLRKSLPVETIRPNDAEIIYDFDHEKNKRILHHKLTGQLTTQYLNGFPLVDATVSAKASVYPIRQPFEKFKQYTFSSDKTTSETAVPVYQGKTDERGVLRIDKTPDFRQFNAKVNVVLGSSIELPGGGLNQESQSFLVDPFERYVGIKNLRGEGWRGSLSAEDKQNIPVVLVDRQGKKVAGTRKLRVLLMKYKNSWWIDRYALSRNASYQRSQYWTSVGEFTLELTNGEGVFEHQVKQYGKGSFMIIVQDGSGGHEASNYYTIYDEQAAAAPLASPDALMVQIDKDECMAGESFTLQYPEFESARALISIEQGDRIIDQFWKELNPQNRSIVITTDENWSPNVYIHSTLLQAYGTVSNDRPLRMYSVQSLLVKQEEPKVFPKITMPDEIETGQSFEIEVHNEEREAMEYTLAVVDEGLLNLTGFDTPDPHKHFQGKKSLRVNTWDIYKMLMRRFDGEFAGILSIGGDNAYRADVQTDLNRFKSVVKFVGPVKLPAGKTAKHAMSIDQFIGKLRVMLIACNGSGAGMDEKGVLVKSPLMLQTQLPRSLNVHDKVRVPITIFKDAPDISSATLTAETSGAIVVLDNDKKIS